MKESALYALSPLDGRYYLVIADVRSACSEYSLIQRRLLVEIAWFKHLCDYLPELSPLSEEDDSFLQSLADDEQSAIKIKTIEESLRHDVKAVEVFLAEKLKERPSLAPYTSFLHFACTSEDINNLCYGLMLKELRQILLSDAGKLVDKLTELATATAAMPMLARTHGQPASPTTMGKEMAVFVHRLHRQLQILEGTVISGKFNGATGNYNAHLAAYPELDWPDITSKLIESLGLQPHPCTTQVEPQDDIAAMLHAIVRVNNILLDACRDFWGYISLGHFKLAAKSGEVGSSTMPHKVNPIDFENAEGNLGIANTLLSHLADNLPLSRWQRDLSGSTRLRNIGVAAGHTALAWRNMARGLGLLEAHGECMRADLNGHTEILAEAVQTVMRKHGMGDAYDKLKQASRGTAITEQQLHALIDNINIPDEEKQRLRQLSPQTYTGNAELQAKTLPK